MFHSFDDSKYCSAVKKNAMPYTLSKLNLCKLYSSIIKLALFNSLGEKLVKIVHNQTELDVDGKTSSIKALYKSSGFDDEGRQNLEFGVCSVLNFLVFMLLKGEK